MKTLTGAVICDGFVPLITASGRLHVYDTAEEARKNIKFFGMFFPKKAKRYFVRKCKIIVSIKK